MIANDARCSREITFRIATVKAAFNKEKTFLQQTGLKFKEETSKTLRLEHSFVW
jgi:isoprenylcysteine carboxyl methyltransferase (ICMT) family protein YpbQ